MKSEFRHLLSLILLLLFPFLAFSAGKIDNKDSIVFDLTNSLIKNGMIEIPLYISSDDDINALDFSVKFNENKLKYDKVLDNTSYIEDLAFYSPITKFLRFTSNSFTNYEKKKTILTLRFLSDSLAIYKEDFFELSGYLNGEPCTIAFMDSIIQSNLPKNVRSNNNFREYLSCGDQHSVALQTNGDVWTWGNNDFGQLGNATNVSSSYPLRVKGLGNAGNLTNVIAVSAGANHTLALLCNGKLISWGDNSNGQLGDSSNISSNIPVEVKGLPTDVSIYAISAGSKHSMALMSDGSVWSWGDNSFGQLGINNTINSSVPTKVRGINNVAYLNNAKEIVCGDFHNLILLHDGTLVSFGNNQNGQLGNGNSGGVILAPINVSYKHLLGSGDFIKQLDAGSNFSLALLDNGKLLAWGDNSKGQLGDGTTKSRSIPDWINLPTSAKQITCGFNYAAAILIDATTWSWGDNSQGQLANNESGNMKMSPVMMLGLGSVDFFTGAYSIAAGKDFIGAIINKSSGGLFCLAGANQYGQLGDSTLVSKSFFVANKSLLTMELPVTSVTPGNEKTICASATVNFNAVFSKPAFSTVFWYFGQGSNPEYSNQQSPPAVSYGFAGEKIIQVIVSQNGACNQIWRDTIIHTINIIPSANAQFSAANVSCQNQSLNFYNAGSTGKGVSHLWNFGDEIQVSQLENPKDISYQQPGAYVVSHTVVIPDCALSDKKTFIVTINPVPNIDFETQGKACVNDTVNFKNKGASSIGSTYFWEFGSGASIATSNVENPAQIYYKTAGVKKINFFITNQFGCINNIEKSFEIKNTPDGNFESSALVSLCSAEKVDFIHTGDSTHLSYSWSFGQDAVPSVSQVRNPVGISYNKSGLKTVKLIVLNIESGCSVQSEKVFTVNESPVANFDMPESDCAKKSLQFSNLSQNADQANFYWDFGSGAVPPSSNSNQPETVKYVSAGIKNVKLSVSNSFGCNSIITKEYEVKAMPNEAFAGSDFSVCFNQQTKLGEQAVEGKSYYWTPSEGLDDPSLANPVAQPKQTTTYFLTVTDPFCDAAIDSVIVKVNELPIIKVSANDTIVVGQSVELSASGGVLYQWKPATGLNFTNDANPLAKPSQTTTYQVFVTDENGCRDSSSVMVFVKYIDEERAPNTFMPSGFANNKFYINMEPVNDFEFIIFNNWGQSIFYTKDVSLGWDGKHQVTGEDMPQGAYVYFVNGRKQDGTPINKQGLINLIR